MNIKKRVPGISQIDSMHNKVTTLATLLDIQTIPDADDHEAILDWVYNELQKEANKNTLRKLFKNEQDPLFDLLEEMLRIY